MTFGENTSASRTGTTVPLECVTTVRQSAARSQLRLDRVAGVAQRCAEEAVVREVLEESSIVARDPEYVTSQPWPFPASLMLGFHARSDGGDPISADGELAEGGFYELETVRAARDGDESTFKLPPSISIARHTRPVFSAASSVEPDPTKGSMTSSPRLVTSSSASSSMARGLTVG